MAEYKVTETELTDIANAIREKGNINDILIFPNEFISAIEAIPEGIDAPDATGVSF